MAGRDAVVSRAAYTAALVKIIANPGGPDNVFFPVSKKKGGLLYKKFSIV